MHLISEGFLLRRYHIDPSGTYIRFEAKAIGAGSEGAQSAIQEGYNKVMVFFQGGLTIRSLLHYF